MANKKILLRADLVADVVNSIRSILAGCVGDFKPEEDIQSLTQEIVTSIFDIYTEQDEDELDLLSERFGEMNVVGLIDDVERFYLKLADLGIVTWSDVKKIDINVKNNDLMITVANKGK